MTLSILRCAALAMSLLLAGCGALKQSVGPEPLGLPDGERTKLVSATADAEATAKAVAPGNEADRRSARNAYIANRLVLLDIDFLAYLRSLGAHKRTLDSAAEGTVLALSVLGTVLDSVNAKENLAAAVALVTGLKSNVDKNFFENRGLDAITSTMIARRKEVLARLIRNLPGSTDAYPLVAARGDLNDYYLAGTMDGAFLTIQSEASKRDESATRAIEQARETVRVTETLGTDTRATKRTLTAALGGPGATPANVRKALLALGIPEAQPPMPDADALRLLHDIVFGAQTTAKVNDLQATFKDAGLLPR
jgi:hypothetical protein